MPAWVLKFFYEIFYTNLAAEVHLSLIPRPPIYQPSNRKGGLIVYLCRISLAQSEWLMWQLSYPDWAPLTQTTLLVMPLQSYLADPPIYWMKTSKELQMLSFSTIHSNS